MLTVEIVHEVCGKLDAKLVRNLGAGAFKQAFLIEQESSFWALKIAVASTDLKARFERETAALQGCDHPAIASIRFSDSILISGQEFWVILEEFLPEGTLSELVAKAPLSDTEICHLGARLSSAIAHMFERSFVHRDIKPANILFRNKSEPVLTDFGLVRILGQESLTMDFLAQGPGTPMYSAPEQLLNEKYSIDWRTDQFGLAVVLAELVLGKHPYMPEFGGSARDAIIAVANRQSLPEANRVALEQRGFGALVKALSPWPVHRFRQPIKFMQSFGVA